MTDYYLGIRKAVQLDIFKCVLLLTVYVPLRRHRKPSLSKGSVAIRLPEVNQSLSVDFSGLCEISLQLHTMLDAWISVDYVKSHYNTHNARKLSSKELVINSKCLKVGSVFTIDILKWLLSMFWSCRSYFLMKI